MSRAMQTRLLTAAMNELIVLSETDENCRAWAAEMQGGLLLDVGDDSDTLLMYAEEEERICLFQKTAQDRLLDIPDGLNNLVFAFGGKAGVGWLLHAVRNGQEWRLRLMECQKNSHSFCPAMGVLDIECTGMGLEDWPLGGGLEKANAFTALMLMDLTLTAFTRARGYRHKKLQHRVDWIDFMDEAFAA